MKFFTEQQAATWPEYFDEKQSISLVNGEKLIRRFGPGQPGLCFILSDDNIDTRWEPYPGMDQTFFMVGKFWVSRKGTSCFRPNAGKDILTANWYIDTPVINYKDMKKCSKYARRTSTKYGDIVDYYIF